MVMKKSIYTVNGSIVGEKTTGGSRIDYLTDMLGSVTATVNQSAQVRNTYRYKPYGGTLAKTGTDPDPTFGWIGTQGYRPTQKKFSDFYVRARHPDSATGRWSTVDPIGYHADSWSLFAYALGNPVTFIDPSGLIPPTLPLPPYVSPCAGRPGDCDNQPGGVCGLARLGYGDPPTVVVNGRAYPISGGVFCCNGIKYACSFLPPGTREGINECTRAHERDHFGEVTCPKYGFDWPGFNQGEDQIKDECHATPIGIECFKRARKAECSKLDGDAKTKCLKDYNEQIKNDCLAMRDVYRCPAAQIPRECDKWLK